MTAMSSWYQSKLWQLLPAVYRAQDATATGAPGPLQELLNRIGAQTATLRRSIDRLWENQSIETCDDWVIPYIGDLLATRLVSCLDARAQRLDVAKTIYYRRRAGTLGLLEELVADIAGRDARAVEFFRRLGRTRHQFDPPDRQCLRGRRGALDRRTRPMRPATSSPTASTPMCASRAASRRRLQAVPPAAAPASPTAE